MPIIFLVLRGVFWSFLKGGVEVPIYFYMGVGIFRIYHRSQNHNRQFFHYVSEVWIGNGTYFELKGDIICIWNKGFSAYIPRKTCL